MPKNNAKRNKAAGHAYERKHVRLFQELLGFKDVSPSRDANLQRDREGIDLTNSNESVYGRLFIDVQCKKMMSREVNLPKVLENMRYDPNRLRVVFWEQTYRCMEPGIHYDCMVSAGEYAFFTADDAYKLLDTYVKYHGLNRLHLPNQETELERYKRVLGELVALKVIKETLGETEDYLERKPKAWEEAKNLVGITLPQF
jgi:hypothetical protein